MGSPDWRRWQLARNRIGSSSISCNQHYRGSIFSGCVLSFHMRQSYDNTGSPTDLVPLAAAADWRKFTTRELGQAKDDGEAAVHPDNFAPLMPVGLGVL